MIKHISDIKFLRDQNIISHLDYYFALYLCDMAKENNPLVKISCALLSRSIAQGHICFEIDEFAGKPLEISEPVSHTDILCYPEKKSWTKALLQSPLVSDSISHPLVYASDQKLYLAKYHDFQTRLVQNILQRIQMPSSASHLEEIRRTVHAQYPLPVPEPEGIAPQKKAVINSLVNAFSIISGGPGTGKTHITRILINIIEKFPQFFGTSPKIVCLAPTGKAATKLPDGMTIHRALKYDSQRLRFVHDKNNPIVCDVAIVDEASMIDIALMTRLFEAIPLTAKLIILGDKNQLSSVEAGAVFGDICQAKRMSDYITHLEYNFRSHNQSSIDVMATAFKNGATSKIRQLMNSDESGQIVFHECSNPPALEDLIRETVLNGYRSFVKESDPIKALENLDKFKILCAHKNGPFGANAMNHLCKNILRSLMNSDIQDAFFKRIIMININSYPKKLFNGDTGIIYNEQGLPRAVFKHTDDTVVSFNPFELPAFEDAFAMTIHKSQGSEFDDILMVLPGASSFITRQLVYTGLTRARKKVTIVGNLDTLLEASTQSIARNSNIPNLIDKPIIT